MLASITAALHACNALYVCTAGLVSAPVYVYGEAFMDWLHIDDPVSAFAVHGMCGMWGVLFVGLLGKEEVGLSK